MSSAELLVLKQQIAHLSELERREVSAFIIRLGQETEDWKMEMTRRLQAMQNGHKVTASELRQQIGNE